MRGSVTADLADRCPRCLLRPDWCYCSRVPTVQVRTRLVIIRHHKERFRTSNTGRLVQQAIPGTVLLDYGAPGEQFDPAWLPLDGAGLLFPEGSPAAAPPKTLIILDGSWPQARRMVRRVPALGALPRLSLAPAHRAPRRARRQPQPEGMATIEAVARALDQLEGPGTGAPLDAIFADMVDTLHRLRGKVRPRG
jgi:DTW domain-containing protein YfiP